MRACLFGAAPDSGNLGVEALYRSVVNAMERNRPGSALCVFDNGWGVRDVSDPAQAIALEHCGVRLSRRFHRPESWANIQMSARLKMPNPVVERVRRADLVMDVSGGDSFSDIYGPDRLRAILAPKHLTLSLGRPLVLLPQTYGPFSDNTARGKAQEIIQRATLAYARDADSYSALLDLAGPDADTRRLRLGVDMAFALDPADPGSELPPDLRTALSATTPRPRVGLNVSGLLYGDEAESSRLGLQLDYRLVIIKLAERLLANDCDVYLVPHVAPSKKAGGPAPDDDVAAISDLAAYLNARPHAERVFVVPPMSRAAHTKWVISKLDWFCGTRMHATIAGLSSGVPTAAIAYSFKTRGVFASYNQGDQVVDAREVHSDQAVARLWELWLLRDQVHEELSNTADRIVGAARQQLEDILGSR